MAGYSEVIQTMAAMLVFSLILLSANRMIQRNNVMQVEGELEQETIALAQDILEEARTQEFDEQSMGPLPPAKIPADFTPSGSLGRESGETSDRTTFDDFDDYDDWSGTVETEHGTFNLTSQVYYVTPDTYDSTGSQTTFKKLKVYITSDYLNKGDKNKPTKYYFEFIRNYYAD